MADQATTVLNIFRGAEINGGGSGSDKDVREFFDSLKVQQHDSRAVLTAVLSPAFIRKIAAEAPVELGPAPEPAIPAPPPPSIPKKHRAKLKAPKNIAPAPK
jgi:hypothetical protein